MSKSYQKFMNTIRKSLTVTLSLSTAAAQQARAEYEALTGTDNTYEHSDIWDKIYRSYSQKFEYANMSLNQIQTLVEPLRIAHPDQCVSISTDDKCFIGNTTWNDQMKMFWEYETYTPQGAALAAARKTEAEAAGLRAAWE
jgi:hypothetical protein